MSTSSRRAQGRLCKFLRNEAFRAAPVRSLLRLVEWRVRCWLGQPVAIDWPGHAPLAIAVPPVWTSAYVAMFVFRGVRPNDRELDWLSDRLGDDATFLDIGANIGQWTIPMGMRAEARGGRVLAVEPAAATAAALARSIELNGLARTELVRAALAASDGKTLLHHHDRDPSQHSLGGTGGTTEEVPTRSLGSVLGERGIDRVDAIKMDVEGAEQRVLEGASDVLASLRPTIIFEVRTGLPERLGLEPDGAWQVLLDAGYQTYRLDAGGTLVPVAPESLAQQTWGWNVIALPS